MQNRDRMASVSFNRPLAEDVTILTQSRVKLLALKAPANFVIDTFTRSLPDRYVVQVHSVHTHKLLMVSCQPKSQSFLVKRGQAFHTRVHTIQKRARAHFSVISSHISRSC
jgi:hypothetical protein